MQREEKRGYVGTRVFCSPSRSPLFISKEKDVTGVLGSFEGWCIYQVFMCLFPSRVSKINRCLFWLQGGKTFEFYFLAGCCNRFNKGESGKRQLEKHPPCNFGIVY